MKDNNYTETESDVNPKPVFVYKANPDSNRLTEFPFLVRHPSRDVLFEEEVKENLYFKSIVDPEIKPETSVAILCSYSSFKKAKNPIDVIETFMLAHKENLYPPFWVLDYIADAFEKYRKMQGTKSLDEIFGLKIGKGQTPLFKKDAEDRRDEMLCHHVFNLCQLFNISIEDACSIVAQYFREEDWNKTLYDIRDISADTLQDRYIKKWKKIFTQLYSNKIMSGNEQKDKTYLQRFLDRLPDTELQYLKEKYSL